MDRMESVSPWTPSASYEGTNSGSRVNMTFFEDLFATMEVELDPVDQEILVRFSFYERIIISMDR